MSNDHSRLINEFLNGSINRRSFIKRAVATGMSAPVVASLLMNTPFRAGCFDAATHGTTA
jgi:hypothetical protein